MTTGTYSYLQAQSVGGVSWEGHSNLGAPKPSDKGAFEYMCGNCNSGILLKGTKLAERDLKP